MPDLVVDALDASKVDAQYLQQVSSQPHASVLHVTVNNLRNNVPDPDLRSALVDLALYGQLLETHRTQAVLMDSRAAWDAIRSDGRVGLVLGYQNSGFIGADFALIGLLYQAGVRVLQITHNGPNEYGGGCAVPDAESGVTALGRDFVRCANEAGILIDCSHASDRLTIDVCQLSEQPVLLTHANPSAVSPHRRNRGDEAIQAVAATGGIIGITFLPSIAIKDGQLTPSAMMDHISHAVDLVGSEAIGFGSEFTTNQDLHGDRYAALRADGVNVMAGDLPYPVEGHVAMTAFFETMRRHGFSEEVVAGFAGANFARVFRANVR